MITIGFFFKKKGYVKRYCISLLKKKSIVIYMRGGCERDYIERRKKIFVFSFFTV